MGTKSIVSLIAVFALYTCIDPYTPVLSGYGSLLVIDGLITDENTSYTVNLSRTFQDQNTDPVMVSDATVFITDDENESIYLNNTGSGIYKTDSTEFKGIAGRTYILHVLTSQGSEYESEPCLMQAVPGIDTIYFEKDQEFGNNGTVSNKGIRIYIDSKGEPGNNYYRWSYEETWKFRIPNPKSYDYIDMNTIVPIANTRQYCWKIKSSEDVIIHSVNPGQGGRIEKEPILFVASDKSDRLMIEYSVLIKQYSISNKEYDFWNKLKKVDESGEDIFASQPFPVIGNIHNINDPKERILGYFQVSSVRQKRTLIPFSEIVKLSLPFYHPSACERIEVSPEDYSSYYGGSFSFDDLYSMFCIQSDYTFIEPIYISGTNILEKLVFSRPECSDCEATGTNVRPDFWIDLN